MAKVTSVLHGDPPNFGGIYCWLVVNCMDIMVNYGYIYIFWVVVYLLLWKIWKSNGMIIPNILKNEIHVPNHQTDWFVSNESINLVFLGDLREQCNPRPRPAEFPFHAQHDPFLLMTEQHYRALLQVVNLRGPMGSQCVHRSVSTSQPWGWPECSCSTSCATDPP